MYEILDAILTIFTRGFQLLLVWLVIVLFIPGMVWFDHVWSLVQYIIVYPSGYIFDFFVNSEEFFKSKFVDDANPIETFAIFFMWILCVGLALAAPVAYWAFMLFAFVVALFGIFPALMNIQCGGPESENMGHLLNGRITIDESFQMEAQANEIASSLNRHR